jgi:hypothetical protein
MSEIHQEVRKYFQQIGSKGGAAGKGSELRRELNRRAARIRWKKHRKKKSEKNACTAV